MQLIFISALIFTIYNYIYFEGIRFNCDLLLQHSVVTRFLWDWLSEVQWGSLVVIETWLAMDGIGGGYDRYRLK